MALKINGEVVQFTSNGPDTIIEIDNSDDRSADVELRLTDVNEADPSGRFRIRVSGDTLEIHGATNRAGWLDDTTLLAFDRTGITKLALSQAGAVSLMENLMLLAANHDDVAWRIRQLINVVQLGHDNPTV